MDWAQYCVCQYGVSVQTYLLGKFCNADPKKGHDFASRKLTRNCKYQICTGVNEKKLDNSVNEEGVPHLEGPIPQRRRYKDPDIVPMIAFGTLYHHTCALGASGTSKRSQGPVCPCPEGPCTPLSNTLALTCFLRG